MNGAGMGNSAGRIQRGGRPELLSIIVPCFNEQEALPLFIERLGKVLDGMEVASEILLIDDGSGDGTLDIMKALSGSDRRIHYLSFSRNFGKEAAMYAGLQHAQGDYVAIMDADMQDPPSLLPEMLTIIREEAVDSVATRREDRQGESAVRSWFARHFYRIINKISDAEIVDGARDFRLMRRRMVNAVVSMGEYGRFSKGIFGWVGFKTRWLSFPNTERVAGQSKWSFWKLLRYAVDGIVNFSHTPLHAVSWFGLGMTGVSFAALLFVIIRRLMFGDPVSGWASTICVILFACGVQLLCLGIIGQYLTVIYTETKQRPHYIIAETDLLEEEDRQLPGDSPQEAASRQRYRGEERHG